MSELVLAPELAHQDVIRTGAEVEGAAPVLITEQEVMFATAAAVLPRQRTARWWTAIARVFATAKDADASGDDRRTPRHYPQRRNDFMEYAAMSREMSRL
jgi:hypothetical protein